MLIIKNTGMPRFKLKLIAQTPEDAKSKITCVAEKGGTITIANEYMQFVDVQHLLRCEKHKVIKLYSIVERKAPRVEMAARPVAKKPTVAGTKKIDKNEKTSKSVEVNDA